jgi:hypothetical protein
MTLAAVLVVGSAQAAELTELERAGMKWMSCIQDAAVRFSKGPDSAEFIARAALQACPQDFTSLMEAAKHEEKNPENLSRYSRIMEYAGTKILELTIANARSK